jgi:hypothetical protein
MKGNAYRKVPTTLAADEEQARNAVVTQSCFGARTRVSRR